MSKRNYSEITPAITSLAEKASGSDRIPSELFEQKNVYRGLRDLDGNGVMTGLTEISEINAKEIIDGKAVPCAGSLYYRGIDVRDLVAGFSADERFGFEETVYLLLFGSLPTQHELGAFTDILADYRSLPPSFTRDVIMKAPSTDMMNTLARCVLTMYAYDNNPDDISIPNVLRQCLQLIATFPLMSVYGYQAYNYYKKKSSRFFIHDPRPDYSTAENLLWMLREDGEFSREEARVLDLALVLHAEHGGGNNSTFADRVITSSGTDTYAAIAGALGSLKGPKHGGANLKVIKMFEDIRKNVADWRDDDEIAAYLQKILDREAFDKAGLIYGMGHAVYSVSDPRAEIFKDALSGLAKEKHQTREYELYKAVERIAPVVIEKNRKMYKGVSANIDFYSGYMYKAIGIPLELYTPIFAVSRIAGWSAHRIEELINAGKIIRPAYGSVGPRTEYVPLSER